MVMFANLSLEFLNPVGHAKHGDEVSTSGGAPYCNSFRIDSIFFSMCPEPANCCFAVMNLGGPDCFPAESVCNRGSNITPGFYECGNTTGDKATPFIPIFPTTSVNPHDKGEFLVVGGLYGQDEV